jgi:PAS domain S-box-containing protein
MSRLKIRTKLTLLLLVFGLLPLAAAMPIVFNEFSKMESVKLDDMLITTQTVGEIIDRNLFERYGDVQAFVANTATKDQKNWYGKGTQNALVSAMDTYMVNYGFYKLMVLVDLEGNVAAVNSSDNQGKPINTKDLYAKNFKGATWFQKAVNKEFLKTDVLTGTVVEQPHYESFVAESYQGEDGFTLTFAAPAYDANGKMIGVWANFADFGLVEGIVKHVYDQKKAAGAQDIAFAIEDNQGIALVNYDPAARADAIKRDSNTIGKKSLASLEIPLATAALKAATGRDLEKDLGSGEEDAASWSRTDGAMGFAGLDWTVIMHQPAKLAFADITASKKLLFIIMAISLVVVGVAGAFVGTLVSKPLRKAAQNTKALAAGDYTLQINPPKGRDELAELTHGMMELRNSVEKSVRLESMITSLSTPVMMCDKDFNITYANDVSIAILRKLEKLLPVKADKIVGSNIDIFHKSPSHQRGMLQSMKLPHKAEFKLGDEWLSLTANPLPSRDGSFQGSYVDWNVVTDSKRADELNTDYAGKMAAISKTQAVIEFNMDGSILTANENFLQAMMYNSLDEIKSKHHSILVDAAYRTSPEYKSFWEALNRGEAQNGEFKRLKKNGEVIWLQAIYNPIPDASGKFVKVVKYATDISKQKLAIEEINNLIAGVIKGDLSNRIDTKQFEGFYRDMTASMIKLMESVDMPVNAAVDVLNSLSQGDLTRSMAGDYQGSFNEMQTALNGTIEKLFGMVKQIIEAAQAVNSAATEIASGSTDLSQRTEEQASSLGQF